MEFNFYNNDEMFEEVPALVNQEDFYDTMPLPEYDYDFYTRQENPNLYQQNPNQQNPNYYLNQTDRILRRIERYNPVVFRTLSSYGVPERVARNYVRRIISLTLRYYR
ncbi:MAG: hypothetical protein K0R54_3494 [Clostridiaceae bacterium]|jgi:hypothetical protein|nr:hypothetical protein [Clostridiaceae bacterium]